MRKARSMDMATHGGLRGVLGTAAILVIAATLTSPSVAAGPPEIRTSATNRVPACVTPERLDAFIRTRNDAPLAKFHGIGALYKKHGDAYRVRWDYAFFQMVIETNYLMFKRGDGKQGDVSPRQNNFAGIGATGGGVPGDSYPDVSTGVLAQIQHLVAYSGERVSAPVAPRTRDKQDDIIAISLRLGRGVTFADLRGRWAADRNYARSIETIAERFKEQFCTGQPEVAAVPAPRRAERPRTAVAASVSTVVSPPPPASVAARTASPSAASAGTCRVLSASYGGSKTMLIRAEAGGETHFTALTVVDGFERSMVDSYLQTRAPGGQTIGAFETPDAALKYARTLCNGTT